jgi:P63C domain
MKTSKEPKGRAKGGVAVAESMTPEQLKERAQKGALARWGAKATHKGNFKDQFGLDVDCYVIDDASKTAVISQRGMAVALGLETRSGAALPRFIGTKAMSKHLGVELREKLEKPLIFQAGSAVVNSTPTRVYGYDVTMLIDICKGIIEAETAGDLRATQANIAKQAHIIVGASAKAGIKGLVYALAGYSPSTVEVIEAFKLYVQEEAKKYEREFPPELYAAWQRLYQIASIQGRGRPWEFMHLTVNHIYNPLAQSNGKVLELLRALKSKGGDRRTKLFQFLNDIGSRALRMQIGRVLEMAEDSAIKYEYEARIKKRFGGQQEFDFSPATGGESDVAQVNAT